MMKNLKITAAGIYDLSNMKVETDSNGNLIITINENGGTFNQKITFRNGTAYMEIGQNGATTYIESSGLEEGLGWAPSERNSLFSTSRCSWTKEQIRLSWYSDHGDKRRTLDPP